MSRFNYDDSIPVEFRQVVKSIFDEYECVLPPTLSVVDVMFKVEDDGDGSNLDACATAEIEREYRRATITLWPYFLKRDEEGRREDVRHELAHLITDHVTDAYAALFDVVIPKKGALYEYAKEQIRKANEAMTQDLSESWARLEKVRAGKVIS